MNLPTNTTTTGFSILFSNTDMKPGFELDLSDGRMTFWPGHLDAPMLLPSGSTAYHSHGFPVITKTWRGFQ